MASKNTLIFVRGLCVLCVVLCFAFMIFDFTVGKYGLGVFQAFIMLWNIRSFFDISDRINNAKNS